MKDFALFTRLGCVVIIALVFIIELVGATGSRTKDYDRYKEYEEDMGYREILEGVQNETDVVKNLVDAFLKINMDMRTLSDLDEQVDARAAREGVAKDEVFREAAAGQGDGNDGQFYSFRRNKDETFGETSGQGGNNGDQFCFPPKKTEEQKRDEYIITKSLVDLSRNQLKENDACEICCACKRNKELLSAVNVANIYMNFVGKNCSRRVLFEIEKILNENKFVNAASASSAFKRTARESVVFDKVVDGSPLLNSLFMSNKQNLSVSSSDVVKRIIEIPKEHNILKAYLIILLDSILIDMCNCVSCGFCSSLYAKEGFIVYRVVRTVNSFKRQKRMNNMFGVGDEYELRELKKSITSLGSAQEVCYLLRSLDIVFYMIRLRRGVYSLMNSTFKRNAVAAMALNVGNNNTGLVDLCDILLNMIGLTVVMNKADMMYYFAMINTNVSPMNISVGEISMFSIPNIYNKNVDIYYAIEAGGVGLNNENISNIINSYNASHPNSIIQKNNVLRYLEGSNLLMQQNLNPGNVKLRLSQTVPFMNVVSPNVVQGVAGVAGGVAGVPISGSMYRVPVDVEIPACADPNYFNLDSGLSNLRLAQPDVVSSLPFQKSCKVTFAKGASACADTQSNIQKDHKINKLAKILDESIDNQRVCEGNSRSRIEIGKKKKSLQDLVLNQQQALNSRCLQGQTVQKVPSMYMEVPSVVNRVQPVDGFSVQQMQQRSSPFQAVRMQVNTNVPNGTPIPTPVGAVVSYGFH